MSHVSRRRWRVLAGAVGEILEREGTGEAGEGPGSGLLLVPAPPSRGEGLRAGLGEAVPALRWTRAGPDALAAGASPPGSESPEAGGMEPGSFHAVVALGLLRHRRTPAWFLERAYRLLAPGSFVVLVERGPGPASRILGGLARGVLPQEITRLLLTRGFSSVGQLRPPGSGSWYVSWGRRPAHYDMPVRA